MLIYVCSSSHGFGHAARDAAVLQQLRRLRPDWCLVMSSRVSAGFLSLLLGDEHIEQRSGLRQSLVRDRRGTAYLNAACVPRSGRDAGNQQLLHFSWAEFEGPALTHLSHRWYQPDGRLMHQELLPRQEPLAC